MKIRYLGRTPKVVELPIPFIYKSEKTGQVICDPVGEFSQEDGERLLEIAGDNGMFVLEKSEEDVAFQDGLGPLCECGCGERIILKPSHKNNGVPRFIMGHATKLRYKEQGDAVPAVPEASVGENHLRDDLKV